MPIENRDWYKEHYGKLLKSAKNIWVGEGYNPEQERCPKCGVIFPNDDALQQHTIAEHSQEKTQNGKDKQRPWYKRLFKR